MLPPCRGSRHNLTCSSVAKMVISIQLGGLDTEVGTLSGGISVDHFRKMPKLQLWRGNQNNLTYSQVLKLGLSIPVGGRKAKIGQAFRVVGHVLEEVFTAKQLPQMSPPFRGILTVSMCSSVVTTGRYVIKLGRRNMGGTSIGRFSVL